MMYKIVHKVMDNVALPVQHRFVKGKLREFQHNVVDPAAVRLGISSEEFTDESRQEYCDLITMYMDQPHWDYLKKLTKEEKTELLTHCKRDRPWWRMVVLTFNFENNKLNLVLIWGSHSEIKACGS